MEPKVQIPGELGHELIHEIDFFAQPDVRFDQSVTIFPFQDFSIYLC
jgi:hypothetical protein